MIYIDTTNVIRFYGNYVRFNGKDKAGRYIRCKDAINQWFITEPGILELEHQWIFVNRDPLAVSLAHIDLKAPYYYLCTKPTSFVPDYTIELLNTQIEILSYRTKYYAGMAEP